jgi:TonB family protein
MDRPQVEAMTDMTEAWKQYEGQIVNEEFPLQQYLGGSAQSAVFLTQRGKQAPQKAAIKLIPAQSANGEGQLSRWKQAATLSDPHLIQLFQSGRCRLHGTEYLYAVMEYAEENLSQVLPQRPLTPEEAREMLAPTLDALAYLHDKGFAHTRLKPANILAVNDQLKISSDAICPIGEPSRAPEVPDAYAPPETGRGWIAPSGDVWSLGVTLLETLTQHRPVWDEAKDWEPALPQTIPAPFLEIARGCLRRDPERRWTLGEIAGALQHTLIRRATGAAADAPPEKPVEKPAEKKRALAPAVPVSKTQAKPQPALPPRKASSRWGYVLLLIGGVALAAWIGPRLMNQRVTQQASSPAPEQEGAAPKQEPATPTPEAAQPTPSVADDAKENGQASPEAVAPAPEATPVTPQPVPNAAPSATQEGEVLDQVLPDVPQDAKDTIQGTIRVGVTVHVDAAGEVAGAELTSAGPSAYFAGLALKAAQRWKFNPAEVNGRGVASTWILRFEFSRGATRVVPKQEPL